MKYLNLVNLYTMTERKIYSKKAWNEQIFFNRIKSIIEDFDIKINKVANAETFLPTVDVDVNGRKVMNVVVDLDNESSAANVGYVNEKIEAESGSVFESNGDVVVVEGSIAIGNVGVLVDSHQVGVDDVGNIMIKEAGLYKIDIGLDVSEGFVSGFVELVVSMVNEDDVSTDTVVKKFHLSEGLAN